MPALVHCSKAPSLHDDVPIVFEGLMSCWATQCSVCLQGLNGLGALCIVCVCVCLCMCVCVRAWFAPLIPFTKCVYVCVCVCVCTPECACAPVGHPATPLTVPGIGNTPALVATPIKVPCILPIHRNCG